MATYSLPWFIVTKGERRQLTAEHLIREKIDFRFVVYDKRTAYKLAPFGKSVVCGRYVPRKSGEPAGHRLARKRQWIEDNLVPKDKWYVGLDDDIEHLDTVVGRAWRSDKITMDLFSTGDCPFEGVPDLLIEEMERTGIPYGAVVYRTSPLFRSRRWTYGSQCGSAFFVSRRADGLKWRGFYHDFRRTAQAIHRYGGAVRMNWISHKTKENAPGGIGSTEERKAAGEQDTRALIKEFPGLVLSKANGYQPAFSRKGVNQCRKINKTLHSLFR